MNPVRAGLVTNPSDWRWSGHNGLIGTVSDPVLDLDQLADVRGESLDQLRYDYGESLAERHDGDPGVEYVDGKPKNTLPNAPALLVLVRDVAEQFGLSPEILCEGRRGQEISSAKLVLIERAQRHGYRLKEIAEALNCSPAAVTLLRQRRS